MADARWDAPQTEEGLQTLLTRLEESRKAGDEAQVGRGLLALAQLVKWVRSDNDEPPFQRAHTLTEEALAIFRRIEDERGLLVALRSNSMFIGPDESDRRQNEAMAIAERLGDERAIAGCLMTKARSLGMRDKAEAVRLARRALELFLVQDEKHSAAQCQFSLAIYEDDKKTKYEAALKSARLYREANDPHQAAHASRVAVMYGEDLYAWPDLEPIVEAGLRDSQLAGNRSSEGTFYRHLAKIAVAKGNAEEAQKYLRWQQEIEESDGRTPQERHRDNIQMTKQMIAMAEISGNAEGVTMFKEELKRLKKLRVG